MTSFVVRAATGDDAEAVAAMYARANGRHLTERFAGETPPTASEFRQALQTGNAFLVAEWLGQPCGAVKTWQDEGICWFSLLVSERAGAGRALLRRVEAGAQDAGLRLVRSRVPDGPLFPEYFTRRGYLPVARETAPHGPIWTLERRLPLLTVREQRREDADAIARLTGEDTWPLSQGSRPGHFVLADGSRVVGFIRVRDGGGGVARLSNPVLEPQYRGRKLEIWMAERAAYDAASRGFARAEIGPDPDLAPLRRDFEDRRWMLDGHPDHAPYHRDLADVSSERMDEPPPDI